MRSPPMMKDVPLGEPSVRMRSGDVANNESAGKRKSGKVRHGNPIVFCEAANAARRTKTVFRVIRRGYKKTIIALAYLFDLTPG
jgi:hypothetical protein